ncbi:MAG TPA: adenylate/guanylate cyclase domain-containing protein [Acidimicrobiales bacterium]|nr:adenylate/guanylate cyclase domain-containing protein [Acidimicrobiales bacterium]
MISRETSYAKSDGLDIAYQVVGRGPLEVVFVPGFVSNLEVGWEFPEQAAFLSRLASFCRLVLFDKRGTGLSDRVPLDRLPSLENRMDDVRAVMDSAGSDRAALFGISEGGPMSVLFAATYPERVTHLVLYASYARRADAELDNGAALVDFIERRWGTGEVLAARGATFAHNPAVKESLARMERQSATPSAAAAMVRMASAIDVTEVLSVLRVPTLVLHRRDDPNLRVEAGRSLAKGIPGARFVELGGTDHIPWFGDTDALLDEVEEFLTGTRPAEKPQRLLATVLFTDIVGSTERAAQLGDAAWCAILDRHDRVLAAEVEQRRGRLIKTTGDGVLATFDGPARAVQCAVALRAALRGLGLEIRAGIHTGEIEQRGDDVAGLAVHIGARVCGATSGGEVWVSRTVTDLVAGSGIEFEDRGDHDLKGVPGTWRLFAVAADEC